jgi:hypothetical protein
MIAEMSEIESELYDMAYLKTRRKEIKPRSLNYAYISEIEDSYIYTLLQNKYHVQKKRIPYELVALKRLIIKVKREIKWRGYEE